MALLLATGCRTSGGALDVAGVAALTAGAGVALSETSVGGCGDCYFPPGGMLILGGELVASLAIIDALLLYSREQGSRDQERALAVDRAGELIHKAIQAARAHHCDPVFALDPEIRALDRTTHDVVFMQQSQIAECLGSRDRVWQLEKAAAAAARAGDCDAVGRLDLQIQQLDLDFRAAVFVRDVAISRCLAR